MSYLPRSTRMPRAGREGETVTDEGAARPEGSVKLPAPTFALELLKPLHKLLSRATGKENNKAKSINLRGLPQSQNTAVSYEHKVSIHWGTLSSSSEMANLVYFSPFSPRRNLFQPTLTPRCQKTAGNG